MYLNSPTSLQYHAPDTMMSHISDISAISPTAESQGKKQLIPIL